MTVELATQSFLESADGIHDLDETSLSGEFMTSIYEGKVHIISTDLVREFRIQNRSLDGKVSIFIPNNFSKDWAGDKQDSKIWNLMIDTIASLRKLSGPSLYKFINLKKDED